MKFKNKGMEGNFDKFGSFLATTLGFPYDVCILIHLGLKFKR